MKKTISYMLAAVSAVMFCVGSLLVLCASVIGDLTRVHAYIEFMEKTKMQNFYFILTRTVGILSALFLAVFAIGLSFALKKRKKGFTLIKISVGAFTALFGALLISLAVYNFSSSMVSIAITRDYTAGMPLLACVVVIAFLTVLLFVFCSKSYRMTKQLCNTLLGAAITPAEPSYTVSMLVLGAIIFTFSVFTGGRAVSNIAAISLALANLSLAMSLVFYEKYAKKSNAKTSRRLYMLEEMHSEKE